MSAWAACRLWASSAEVAETPTALPTLRMSESSEVASVRKSGASVAKAMTCRGMKTKPRPAPMIIVLMMMVQLSMSGVHSVCRHRL